MNKEDLIEEILFKIQEYDWTIVSPDHNLRSLFELLSTKTLSLIFTEIDKLIGDSNEN